jgi:hypothetical protein
MFVHALRQGGRNEHTVTSQIVFEYWRHRVSGAIYAVRFEGNRMTGFFGPVAGDDIHPDDLPLYPYSTSDSEVIAWAQAHAEEFFQME